MLTILSFTVSVRIITTEDDASAITRGNLVEPPHWRSSGAFAEVLLKNSGFVTMDKD